MGKNTWSETLALADSPEPLLRLSPGTVAAEHVMDGIHGLARLKPCKVGGLSPGDHIGWLCYVGSPLEARKQNPVSRSKGKLGQGELGGTGTMAAKSPGPDLLCHGPPRGRPRPDKTQSRTWRVFLHITPGPPGSVTALSPPRKHHSVPSSPSAHQGQSLVSGPN